MNDDIIFSIVIPTYNPGKFLPTLCDSLADNDCLDMIEVILSDDLSTEDFTDTLNKYPQLNTRIIHNDKHYGFPRAGRQHGIDEARGKWITFIDQDDYLYPHAFDKLLVYIQESGAVNNIVSDFDERSPETTVRRERHMGWTHGKLYEKAFLQKYNICYDEISYCEDINFSTKVQLLMEAEKLKTYEYNEVFYVWNRRKDSLSDIAYFKKSMTDYINATIGVIIQYIEKYKGNKDLFDYYIIKYISTFWHIYFYFQSDMLCYEKMLLIDSLLTLRPYYLRFKKATGFNYDNIIRLTHTDLIGLYQKVRSDDYSQIPFIEQISFVNWVNYYFEK